MYVCVDNIKWTNYSIYDINKQKYKTSINLWVYVSCGFIFMHKWLDIMNCKMNYIAFNKTIAQQRLFNRLICWNPPLLKIVISRTSISSLGIDSQISRYLNILVINIKKSTELKFKRHENNCGCVDKDQS